MIDYRVKILLHILSVIISVSAAVCHAETDKNAVKNADDFLAALKIFEIPEGKLALTEATWRIIIIGNLPVLVEHKTLFEGQFETDARGVSGYKRLIQAQIQSKGGLQLTEKYLLVSYKDKLTSKWKVWAFVKVSSISVENEIEAAKNRIGLKSGNLGDQFHYMGYGEWLVTGGKPVVAKQALETALAIVKSDPNKLNEIMAQRCQNNLNIIKAICGQ